MNLFKFVMTQEQIIEGNKLIAEFMGAPIFILGLSEEYEMYQVLDCIEDTIDAKHFYCEEELIFHSDWNWLMAVVNKCYEIGNLGEPARQEIEESLLGIIDIEDTYEAVVEFIKWYNANK